MEIASAKAGPEPPRRAVTVLSVDGGGIRGIVAAAFLERLETKIGRVCDSFDYVAGTSTGGILALGLGVPVARAGAAAKAYSAAELVELYATHGARIFSRSVWHQLAALDELAGPKYPEDGVDGVLRELFGEARLKAASTNVLVTAYAIEKRCPFFFRSWQAKAREAYDFAAWEVARSTSAAPTYFPPFRATSGDGQPYALVDGGLFANNPALCAWVEAHDRHPGADIVVVSVGTGNEERPIPFAQAKGWGLGAWAPRLLDVVFDGVSDTVDVELDEMLNTSGSRNYYRFQTDVALAHQSLDDTSAGNVAALRAAGEKMAQLPAFAELCGRLERLRQTRPGAVGA